MSCWLGHKIVSEMTYNVSSEMLDPAIRYMRVSRQHAVVVSRWVLTAGAGADEARTAT